MTRRKKILTGLGVLLVVVLVAGYFIANAALDRATREAMTKVVSLSEQQGLKIQEPSFEQVRLSGLRSARWSGVGAKIRLPEGSDSASERMWDVQLGSMQVKHSFVDKSVVEIDRIMITTEEDTDENGLNASQRMIELSNIRCTCPLSLFAPGKSLREILPEVVKLLTASEFRLPLQLDGRLTFALKDQPVEIGIEVAQLDDSYVLRLVNHDVAKLSDRFQEQLTPVEVELIADYPLRAARLLEIKDAAESDSQQASQQDSSVPEDAYRHVLWSYLLTSTYGEDFAHRVGDAHEAGDTGNSPAEREMDYHNNAIGRDYAQREYKRNSILQRVLKDPEVRREP